MPENSVHYQLSNQFVEAMQRNDPNNKRLPNSSILLIESDKFLIGKGSNSTMIYIGYDLTLESWVAVKCCFLQAHITDHEIQFVRSHGFRNQHSNIGSYLACIEEGSRVFIIMELYEVTLEKFFLKYPSITFKAKCKLAFDLLQGIEFLHSRNIIHRDLKPQNVMINLSRTLKIVDFGISREVDFTKTTTYETLTQGTLLWLPPELLQNIGKQGKIKKEGEIRVVIMLLFYMFSHGKHPFCNLGDSGVNLLQYCADISSSKFLSTLCDPFLQNALEKMFKDTGSFKEVKDVINELNKSHRIKDIYNEDCEIYERTSGRRYAILVSCSNLQLEAARADVTVLKTVLEYCGFSVEARDGISKADFLSSKIENYSNQIEPIAVTCRQIDNELIGDKDDIYIFLHVSAHGYYNENTDDTCLYFEDGVATVKEIVNRIFTIINKPNLHLIFTVEACRDFYFPAETNEVKFPDTSFAVLYSTGKGIPSVDPGGLPGSFACAGPFSSALQENIKPALSLRKVFEEVKKATEEKTGGLCSPETEDANCSSLYNFVF